MVYTTEREDNIDMGSEFWVRDDVGRTVQLEGEELKRYLMKRFNRTEAEAIQIMEEQRKDNMAQHYHVLTGLHGYMPDNNEMYNNLADAKAGLLEFVERAKDDDVIYTDEQRDAISIADDGMSAEFPLEDIAHPVFGVEYAEIADCHEPDCGEELD